MMALDRRALFIGLAIVSGQVDLWPWTRFARAEDSSQLSV